MSLQRGNGSFFLFLGVYAQDLQTEFVNCRINVCRLVNHGRVNVPEKQNLTSCKACVECVGTITGIEP